MKNLFTAVILGIAFAGVSLAHTSSEEKAGERHGAAEMQTKAVKPAIEKLTATLAGLTLG